jgi:hypothetical protein
MKEMLKILTYTMLLTNADISFGKLFVNIPPWQRNERIFSRI